jgi:hypothetical protein
MILGQSRNTLTAAAFPPGADLLRLHDGGCRWSLLNPQSGVYNWARLDAHLAASEARGIPSMYVFSSTPAWAVLPFTSASATAKGLWADNPTGNCPPNPQAHSDFIDALLAHVKRPDGTLRIKYFEMWNETNNAGFWSGTTPQLLALAQTLYQKVKAAYPAALVTTPTPCWDKTNVIQAMDLYLGAGFAQYADIVSFHGYLPDGAPAVNISPTLDALKSLLVKYGVNKPLWDTEYGFKSPILLPDSAKRQWVIDSITTRIKKGIQCAIWYQADNLTHGTQILQNGTLTIAGQAWLDCHTTVAARLPAVIGARVIST